MKLNQMSKRLIVGALSVVLMAGCGKEKGKENNRPGSEGAGGGASGIERTSIYRNFTTVNGQVALSYIFITFSSNVPGATVTAVRMKRNRTEAPVSLMGSSRTGTVTREAIGTILLSTDRAEDAALGEEILGANQGQLYVLIRGLSRDIVFGSHELLVTFNSSQGTTTVSVLTEAR